MVHPLFFALMVCHSHIDEFNKIVSQLLLEILGFP